MNEPSKNGLRLWQALCGILVAMITGLAGVVYQQGMKLATVVTPEQHEALRAVITLNEVSISNIKIEIARIEVQQDDLARRLEAIERRMQAMDSLKHNLP